MHDGVGHIYIAGTKEENHVVDIIDWQFLSFLHSFFLSSFKIRRREIHVKDLDIKCMTMPSRDRGMVILSDRLVSCRILSHLILQDQISFPLGFTLSPFILYKPYGVVVMDTDIQAAEELQVRNLPSL